jgi:hypothetical protein
MGEEALSRGKLYDQTVIGPDTGPDDIAAMIFSGFYDLLEEAKRRKIPPEILEP